MVLTQEPDLTWFEYMLERAWEMGLEQGTPAFDQFVAQLDLPDWVVRATTERYQEINQLLWRAWRGIDKALWGGLRRFFPYYIMN